MKDVLFKLKKELISSNLFLSNNSEDGRVNSSLNEKDVLSKITEINNSTNILEDYELLIPKARYWYDFALKKEDFLIPVNIKITDMKNADNVNSKEGVYYAFTGETDFRKIKSWRNFLKEIQINKQDLDTDYYFLIINKADTKDIFVTSVKCLTEITKNRNNLSFQCKWDNNRIMVRKDFDEAFENTITPIIKACKKLANDYEAIKLYYKEICAKIEHEEALENKQNDPFVLNEELLKEKDISITSEQIKTFETEINKRKETEQKLQKENEVLKEKLLNIFAMFKEQNFTKENIIALMNLEDEEYDELNKKYEESIEEKCQSFER